MLDGETEDRRAQCFVPGNEGVGFPVPKPQLSSSRHNCSAFCFCLGLGRCAILSQPGESLPSPKMTEVFREIFPIIKRICKKTGTASSALKLLGPSWPINCAWLQPSSQSSYPFRRGKGSTAEFPPSPSLALQHQKGPLSVCFRPFHCQCIKDSHTRSFKVRRVQGQVQA